jgi:hypothetical protein
MLGISWVATQLAASQEVLSSMSECQYWDYSVNDRKINECGAVGGIRIPKGNWCAQRKPFPLPLFLPESHLTWPVIKPGLLLWEASDKPSELWHFSPSLSFLPSCLLLYIPLYLLPSLSASKLHLLYLWLILVVEGEVRLWLTNSDRDRMRFLSQGVW